MLSEMYGATIQLEASEFNHILCHLANFIKLLEPKGTIWISQWYVY